MGWIGPTSVVENYLAMIGADKDSEGKFLIAGDRAPCGLLGDPYELVIDDSVVYFSQGQPRPLVANMVDTIGQGEGRGLSVVVI